MRICIVYDCLYPHTVGGAERWYRNLSERLAAEGHHVTYLTLRQWKRGASPGVKGVAVIPIAPQFELYVEEGRRRILPPLVFGFAVFWHLLRYGRSYEVIHTSSFPFFSLLAAGLLRRWYGYRLVVDWYEIWTFQYWRQYLGIAGGFVGWAIQRLCAVIRQRAFCFSRLHKQRLIAEGMRSKITVLDGMYAGSLETPIPELAEPVVVFAGRHIPEKRIDVLVESFMYIKEHAPHLRCEIYGDGPKRRDIEQLILQRGLEHVVVCKGFVDSATITAALQRALCLVLPSQREGYGMVVVEASAQGTPSVVVRDPDNAASELVTPGENGLIAETCDPLAVANAILTVEKAGISMREKTASWFECNAKRLSLANSLDIVAQSYKPRERR